MCQSRILIAGKWWYVVCLVCVEKKKKAYEQFNPYEFPREYWAITNESVLRVIIYIYIYTYISYWSVISCKIDDIFKLFVTVYTFYNFILYAFWNATEQFSYSLLLKGKGAETWWKGLKGRDKDRVILQLSSRAKETQHKEVNKMYYL